MKDTVDNTVIDNTVVEDKMIYSIGEIDYAILKSIIYGIKTIKDIVDVLQIRTIVIERHIYALIKEGFVNIQLENFEITLKGNDSIYFFEKDSSERTWRPIDEFILSSIKQRKEQKIKTLKTLDIILLISIVILVALIIFFGIFR